MRFEAGERPDFARPTAPLTSRVAYAAAHVVPRTTAENVPGAPADIDWDATLAFRHHVWSWGLGVADAMDTAQRNMGLDWAACTELIRRSAAEASSVGGALVVGVNTDHVADPAISLDEVIAAYLEQLEVAEDAGAGVVGELGQRRPRLLAHRGPVDRRDAEPAAHRRIVEREIFGNRQRRNETQFLRDGRDPGRDGVVRTVEMTRPAVNGDRALIWRIFAAENPHQRRLARAVLADQRVDFAGHDVELDLVESARRAEMLGDANRAGRRGAHRRNAVSAPPA